VTFVRRYMSDRAHRLLTDDRAYCGKAMTHGDRLAAVAKLGRCESCEDAFERTPKQVIAAIDGEK
jgi:hypothetical protein